jgi:HD-like signal output (HDOD) protein
MTIAAANRTDQLIRELERLPAEPTAAMRILWIADDSDSSADDLGAVVAADPGLTARIMRMANSAYYGLSGRVRSCAFAVTVLGFSTVRSLAAAMAAGALEDGLQLPAGFWLHSATVATAASIVAPRVGARHAEAFSLGLLHDLGRFLLYRTDPDGYTALGESIGSEGIELLQAERLGYGLDHADAAGRVLKAWRFPDDFAQSLAGHHDEVGTVKTALSRALVGGEALARVAMIDTKGVEERYEAEAALAAEEAEALQLVRIDADAVPALAAQVRRGGEDLAASLRAS